MPVPALMSILQVGTQTLITHRFREIDRRMMENPTLRASNRTGQFFVGGVRQYPVMSDTPNNNSGDGSQGEPPQGGQPSTAEGHGTQAQDNQPQSGQAAGGQPVQGQAPQGQPQGGVQPQGQPAQGQAPQGNYQTGPTVSDIFSRNDTLDQIKLGVVMYALVGFGIGLGMFAIGNSLSGGSGFAATLGSGLAVIGTIGVPIAVSAVLALLLGREIGDELSDLQDNLVYATAGVTALAGSIVAFLLSWIMLGLGTGSITFDGLLVPVILAGIGAAIIAVGTIWTEENFLGPSGAPPQGRQQY